jgi:hypothetical protein
MLKFTMTKETIGSIEKRTDAERQTELNRNFRSVDFDTIAAMKQYFGVEDYAAVFKVVKDMGLNDNSSFSSSDS